jgi:predicted transcriptional regulator
MGEANMSIAEGSLKQKALEIIEKLPDDSTYEEILRELALAKMIDLGLADSDAGRTISHEELHRRILSWQK